MKGKVLSIIGVACLILSFTGCSSSPEKGLLKNYFNAMSLSDIQTLSTMAVDPMSLDFESWELTAVSEETIRVFDLAELDQKAQSLKKQVDESVGVTLEARGAVDDAIYERENSRSASARRAAQKNVDELQVAYDEQYAKHQDLQKESNVAGELAKKEEEIATFSLGADYPSIRQFTGEVFTKNCDVSVKLKGGSTQNYKIHLKRYVLKDEAMNLNHRGRWIINKFEKIS